MPTSSVGGGCRGRGLGGVQKIVEILSTTFVGSIVTNAGRLLFSVPSP